MRSLLSAAAFLSLATLAPAQQTFVFQVNQGQSNFNWSGTSTLGAIVGNPSTSFQMAGTTHMQLVPLGADPIDGGSFPGAGDVLVVPDIHGKVNNVFPFLPPLATIDITNLHLQLSAAPFSINSSNAFNADVVVTALAGTLTVTPLGSAASMTNLAGLVSTPQPQVGALVPAGSGLQLVLPVNSTFPFSDPSSGASGSISIVGTLRADWSCPAAQAYCTAKVNSLGCTPAIGSSGTASYSSAAPFLITATNELNQKSGLVFYGLASSNVPFQGGTKCVAPPTFRSPIQDSGGSTSGDDCSGSYSFDFNATIQSLSNPQLVPGDEVFAQFWSRDPQSASTTNLTDALRFTICP